MITTRFLADDGVFFDDEDADRLEPNGYGQTHGVLDRCLQPSETVLVPPREHRKAKGRVPITV